MKRTEDDFIMLPTVDFCFKELMQNEKVRKGFISALLNCSPEHIKQTTLMPTILSRDTAEDKLGILDVGVVLEDGTQLDMEMQVAYFAYWEKRILFYLAKMYTGQLKKGESYEVLKKCIHVSILDFIHFPEDRECYRVIHFCDEQSGKMYTDLLEIQILELKKLLPERKMENEIIDWMQFFNGKSREEFCNMAEKNEYLSEACSTLMKLSSDEKKRLEYEAREKALRDYNSQMSSARKLGMEQGLREGRQKGLQEGRQKGLQEGRQEGLQEGRQEGLQEGRQKGLQEGRQEGLNLAKKVFRLHLQGKESDEIAEIIQIPVEKVREILN